MTSYDKPPDNSEIFKSLNSKSKKAWIENGVNLEWRKTSSGVWAGSWTNPYYLNRSKLWWKWYNFCDYLPIVLILGIPAGFILICLIAFILDLFA